MKSISFKVPDAMKKDIEKLAKKHRLTRTNLMIALIKNALEKGESATTLYDSDTELIESTIKNFTKKGLKANHIVEAEMRDPDHLLYVPNIWLLEASDATKMIGASEEILKRLKVKNYEVIDKNHELMKKSLKSYNYRARKKINSAEELAEIIFRRKTENPLILVEKIDPLKLTRFCKEHTDKKVYYIMGSQDQKVNRQVF